jgi:hypothetical protein
VESGHRGLAGRLSELADRGILVRPVSSEKPDLRAVARKPGSLARFLKDRDA